MSSKIYAYDSKSPPPAFGHALLPYFGFAPGRVSLNHGSYGSLPNPVSQFCTDLAKRVESDPDAYHKIEYLPLLVEARTKVSEIIGAESVDECVFVANTTTGVNEVLRNFEWKSGDAIVKTSLTYGAVAATAQYISDKERPSIETFGLSFPESHASILERFEAFLRETLSSHEGKIIVLIDAIVSRPGVWLPWKEMVAVCAKLGQKEGEETRVYSLVDAAHAVGQEVDLNLKVVKPDFWVSNCHKWLYAKRGSAILYVPFRNQHIMKSALPTPAEYSGSEHAARDFVEQHEWTGATDFGGHFSVVPATTFRLWLGGEVVINTYCRDLAIQGGKALAEILKTKLLDESENFEATLNMVNVQLPLPRTPNPKTRDKVEQILDERMLYKWNVYASPLYHADKWWIRASAQVFTEISDFEYLGKALLEICKEVEEVVKLEA